MVRPVMAISSRAHWPGNKKSPFHQWKRPVFPCSPRQDPCRYRSRPAATVHGRYSGSAPGFRPSRCQWHMKEAGMRALRRRVRSRFSRDSLLTPAGSGDHGRATLGRDLRLVNVRWKEGDAADRPSKDRLWLLPMSSASRQALPAGPGRYPAVQRGRWSCLAGCGPIPCRSGSPR